MTSAVFPIKAICFVSSPYCSLFSFALVFFFWHHCDLVPFRLHVASNGRNVVVDQVISIGYLEQVTVYPTVMRFVIHLHFATQQRRRRRIFLSPAARAHCEPSCQVRKKKVREETYHTIKLVVVVVTIITITITGSFRASCLSIARGMIYRRHRVRDR